jgi:hypothetical protein
MHMLVAGVFLDVKCHHTGLIGEPEYLLDPVSGIGPLAAAEALTFGISDLHVKENVPAFRGLSHDMNAAERIDNTGRSEPAELP